MKHVLKENFSLNSPEKYFRINLVVGLGISTKRELAK